MAGTPQQCKPIAVGPLYKNIHKVHVTYSTWTGD